MKRVGYHTSYNHNAAYYTLAEVPEFDDWGLWAYRDVRFSRAGALPETLVALVSQAPAGLNVGELEQRLQTAVGNLLSRCWGTGRFPVKTWTMSFLVFGRRRTGMGGPTGCCTT